MNMLLRRLERRGKKNKMYTLVLLFDVRINDTWNEKLCNAKIGKCKRIIKKKKPFDKN